MEHPLIANLDSLTADQLSDKISELNKKLGIAMSTGNYHLCNQIRMVLESYQSAYTERTRRGSGGVFDEVIDIS
jgi:hypothetical protein